jgi:hypothetical protein
MIERMIDDRIAERRPEKEPLSQRQPQAACDQQRADQKRKPGPAERSEWRGSGVCGDRHTD